jgi:regulator of cell morphogenesis and NO signaling
MENINQQSIASLVLKNHQIVPVLEKYSIDFCCKGKANLADACKEKGIDLSKVLIEIDSVQKTETNKTMPFVEMSQAQLVNHIIVNHHYYVKHAMPTIMAHLEKVVKKHGEHYAYMIEVRDLFEIIQKEMDLHMQKEELLLFPRIVQVEKETENDQNHIFSKNYLTEPIFMIESEHEKAGDIMFEIRRLTNKYMIPVGACTTFRVCLAELEEFENDLHQHVHLENNILFPRALQLALAENEI